MAKNKAEKLIKICVDCSSDLTVENCYPSDWADGARLCKYCRKKRHDEVNYHQHKAGGLDREIWG